MASASKLCAKHVALALALLGPAAASPQERRSVIRCDTGQTWMWHVRTSHQLEFRAQARSIMVWLKDLQFGS